MRFGRREFLVLSAAYLSACSPKNSESLAAQDFYDIYSDAFLNYVDVTENYVVLGKGYGWSEGPAWDKKRGLLYFTDVPGNIAYSWSETKGIELFLNPSGSAVTEGFREAGANGLLYTDTGEVLLCNHGERSVQKLDPISKARTTLAQTYQGKKFNSPNDIIQALDGRIYFTDPPYGLNGLVQSPLKELDFSGVYRLEESSEVTVLITDMTFPNGVALSPDQSTLYITQSDPKAPHLYTLDLSRPGAKKELFVDFSKYVDDQHPGLPDGMVIDHNGYIFVTGPGGVFVVSPSGQVLGRIKTGKGSANCTFGEDGSTLFITNHDRLIKLKTKTLGLSWIS